MSRGAHVRTDEHMTESPLMRHGDYHVSGPVMRNTIVLHFVTGAIKKGSTDDFFPNKDMFHFLDRETNAVHEISLRELKAVFFVKNYDGDPTHVDRNDQERTGLGKRIRVCFKDGETLTGYTQGYSENRSGFFVFPCDSGSNNDRVYVVSAATKGVSFN